MGKKKSAKAKRGPARKSLAAKPSKLIQLATKAAVARNARKARDAIAMIARKVDQIVEAFYDIALQLQVLQRMEIYSALGAKSFAEAVEQHTKLSKSTAFELVRIPQHLSREMAVKLGSERSRALIQLTEATPEPDSAEELARRNAEIGGEAVLAQSAVEIRERARAVRAKSKKAKPRPGEREARSAANDLEARLEKRTKSKLTVVPLRRDDRWWLRVEIPAATAKRV